MEYQVPQFIEVESKVVGPLTLKQFLFLAGGGGMCVLAFFYLPLIVAVLVSLPVGGFAVALAFYKVNGKPFIEVLEAGFTFYLGNKLFLWKQKVPGAKEEAATPQAAPQTPAPRAPRLTSGKLSELAWSLDMKNDARRGEKGV